MEVIKPRRFFVKGIKFKRKLYYRKKISLQKIRKEITHKKETLPQPRRLIKTEDYVHHTDYNQTHTHTHAIINIKKINIKYNCLYCETKSEKKIL